MNCNRCGKWAGAHATLPVQPKDHLCMCQPSSGVVRQALKREAAYVTEVETLKEWIRNVGSQADICTRQVLREVCENCRCKHAPKGPNAQ